MPEINIRKQFRVIKMYYASRCKKSEIAEKLRLSINNVSRIISEYQARISRHRSVGFGGKITPYYEHEFDVPVNNRFNYTGVLSMAEIYNSMSRRIPVKDLSFKERLELFYGIDGYVVSSLPKPKKTSPDTLKNFKNRAEKPKPEDHKSIKPMTLALQRKKLEQEIIALNEKREQALKDMTENPCEETIRARNIILSSIDRAKTKLENINSGKRTHGDEFGQKADYR